MLNKMNFDQKDKNQLHRKGMLKYLNMPNIQEDITGIFLFWSENLQGMNPEDKFYNIFAFQNADSS